jgi:polyhydroxyalkanoate synthase
MGAPESSLPLISSELALALDRSAHAVMARMTRGLSPASMALAWSDWLLHLAITPGKQALLTEKMRRKVLRLVRWQFEQLGGQRRAPWPIEPLPQDHRFDDETWRQWPWSVMAQSFLLTQQWWHNATTDVPGVTRHHQQVLSFSARQWLDMFSPSNFLWSNPEALEATAREGGANLVRGAQNMMGDWLRSFNNEPPAEARDFVVGQTVAVTPGKVVYRNHLIELIQYEPQTEKVRPEPVLIVPSWIMKYYILDLSPHNSLVRYLVGQGFTVFMLSWRNPDATDRDLGMDDYLKLGPASALDAIAGMMPERKVHAMGYCLGGTLLAIAAAWWQREGSRRLASLTLLAAETDFSEPGELSLFIDESQLAYLEDMMWAQGYLDGPQMGGSFTFLHARDLLWSRMVREYLMGAHQPLNDLMAWNADVTRMPYRMHAEYLRSFYLENELARGAYKVDDKPVVLGDIDVPMFAVGTVSDHVSPWRSVFMLHLLADAELTFALTNGGHNAGIVNEPGHAGRRFQMATRRACDAYVDPDTWAARTPFTEGSWWPQWVAWLAQRSGEPTAPPPIGAPEKYPPLCDAPGTYVHM